MRAIAYSFGAVVALFPCHQPAKAQDLVFTHYSASP